MKYCRAFICTLLFLAAVAPDASAQAGHASSLIYPADIKGILVDSGMPNEINVLFSDSGILYAGSDGSSFGIRNASGVYASADRGNSWVVDSIGIGSANVQAFAALNGDVFAAAETSFDSSDPGGVFRSTDKGASWMRTLPDNTDALATDGDTLFAAGYNQLYLTTDNGAHWNSISNTIGDRSNLFEFHGSLFIRTSTGSVFRSTNAGVEWSYSGITTYGFPAFAAIGNDIFALNASGVWVSSNDGEDWSSNAQMPGDTGAFSSLIAANNLLVAARGDGGMVYSSDNGATWSYPAQGPVYPSGQPLYFVYALIYDGTDLIFAITDTDAVEVLRGPLSNLDVDANTPEVRLLKVFPNPASSLLHIQGSGSNVEVLDLMGRVVLSSNITGNGILDVTRLEPGRYEAVVHTAKGILSVPVVIQR